MDKKLVEISIMISDTDHRLYYDTDMKNITNIEELLQATKAIYNIGNTFFELGLKHMGIDLGDTVTKVKRRE